MFGTETVVMSARLKKLKKSNVYIKSQTAQGSVGQQKHRPILRNSSKTCSTFHKLRTHYEHIVKYEQRWV